MLLILQNIVGLSTLKFLIRLRFASICLRRNIIETKKQIGNNIQESQR
jgi:hypothetical protein